MSENTDSAVELFNRALELRDQGDLENAESFCAQAIKIFQRVDGANSPDAANLLNVLASLREARGDYAGATCAAQSSINILDALGDQFAGNEATLVRIEAWSCLHHRLVSPFETVDGA